MQRRRIGMDGYERCATPDSSAEAHALWTTRKQQYRVSELVAFIKSYLLPEPAPDRPYVHPAQYKKPFHVRIYSDDMDKNYQPSPWTTAFAALTLGLYIGIPHILMALLVCSWWSRAAMMILLVLLGTLLLPAGPLRVHSVLSSYMFLAWRRYFHFSYVFEAKCDCYKDYIIAQYPHGAFPIACIVGGSFMATEFPDSCCYALAASSAFYVPVWRHVHAWLGTAPCTKNNFHKLLGRGVQGPLQHQHQHQHRHGQQYASATSSAQPAASAGESDVLSAAAVVGCPTSKLITASPFASAVKPAAAAAAGGIAAGLPQQQQQQSLPERHSHQSRWRSSARAAHSLNLHEQELLHKRSSFSLSLASSIKVGMRQPYTLSDAESSSEGSDCDSFTGSHPSLSHLSMGASGIARHSSNPQESDQDDTTSCSSGQVSNCSSCGGPQHYPLVSISSSTTLSRLGKEQAAATAAAAKDAKQQQKDDKQQQLLTPDDVHDPFKQLKLQNSQPQQEERAAHPAGDAAPAAAAVPGCRVDPRTGRRKLGVSVSLMVGGIAEMFMIRPDQERIKIKDRKGFVRIAVEHGTDILPVYMFGANQVLDFGPAWLQRFSRRMRASVGMMYGVWGLPIPRRVPLMMTTGRALVVGPPMSKDHPDFQARVDEVHAEYMREIERVYYEHRGKYGRGFENRPLVLC